MFDLVLCSFSKIVKLEELLHLQALENIFPYMWLCGFKELKRRPQKYIFPSAAWQGKSSDGAYQSNVAGAGLGTPILVTLFFTGHVPPALMGANNFYLWTTII